MQKNHSPSKETFCQVKPRFVRNKDIQFLPVVEMPLTIFIRVVKNDDDDDDDDDVYFQIQRYDAETFFQI